MFITLIKMHFTGKFYHNYRNTKSGTRETEHVPTAEFPTDRKTSRF